MDLTALQTDATPLVESAKRMMAVDKAAELIRILDNGSVKLEETDYDNWNGGTRIYTLFIDVDPETFAGLRRNISGSEQAIAEYVSPFFRSLTNDSFGSVTIQPRMSRSGNANPLLNDRAVIERMPIIWKSAYLRLFLSHVSAHKVAVSQIKVALEAYGVSAFVAHEDIEPNQEWLDEIRIALQSADALAALLTPSFHESNWTDQEVGIAFGLDIPVLNVKLGLDPYGFMGKKQALIGNLSKPKELASQLVSLLLKDKRTHAKMVDALLAGLENSTSFVNADTAWKALKDQVLSRSQLLQLVRASKSNYEVSGANRGTLGGTIESFVNKADSTVIGEVLAAERAAWTKAEEYDPFADDVPIV